MISLIANQNHESSVGIVTRLQTAFFMLFKMLRQAVGPTQAPVGYREVKQPGYEFDHLVQWARMSGATPPLFLYAFLV